MKCAYSNLGENFAGRCERLDEDGFLIGENFMKQVDPGMAIREFVREL